MELPNAPLHGAVHHLPCLCLLSRLQKTHRDCEERVVPGPQGCNGRLDPLQRPRRTIKVGRDRRGVSRVLLHWDVRGGPPGRYPGPSIVPIFRNGR